MVADASSTLLNRTFQALADPGRRAMLTRLSAGPATVSELAEPLHMSLSAVLQHVNYLEDTGLITTRKEGRTRIVEPASSGLTEAREWINHHEAAWHARYDHLGAVLDAINPQPQES